VTSSWSLYPHCVRQVVKTPTIVSNNPVYCAFVRLDNKKLPPHIVLAIFLYAVGRKDTCARVLEAERELQLTVFMLQGDIIHTLHFIQF